MSISKMQIPMLITTSRMILSIPILAGMATQDFGWRFFSAGLFIVASLTDYFDGYYARKLNAVSNLGKFMDPIADKVLVTAVLVALIPQGHIDTWMVILLLTRDTLIGGLRSVAAADQIVIAAKPAGKWKTALQMVAIPAMIVGQDFAGVPILKIGSWVLWGSVILSVISGFEYFLGYLKAARADTPPQTKSPNQKQ